MSALLSVLMLAASAFGGVAEPEPVDGVLTPELLARVIAEAGGIGVWETEEATRTAWRLLMHTALNRYRRRGSPATQFLQGFYRLDPAPPQEAIDMARDVLAADEDPTDGCMYALSAQDLDLLGIEQEGDIVLTGNSVFQLHFYREWHAAGSHNSIQGG